MFESNRENLTREKSPYVAMINEYVCVEAPTPPPKVNVQWTTTAGNTWLSQYLVVD